MKRWLVPMLSMFALNAHATEPEPARHVTFIEIYRAYEAKTPLTPTQALYLHAVQATVSQANAMAWSDHGRGLYCLPDRQRLDDAFVLSVIDNEVRSERGWVHMDDEPVARIVVAGLASQYPCTDEAVDRINRQEKELMESLFK